MNITLVMHYTRKNILDFPITTDFVCYLSLLKVESKLTHFSELCWYIWPFLPLPLLPPSSLQVCSLVPFSPPLPQCEYRTACTRQAFQRWHRAYHVASHGTVSAVHLPFLCLVLLRVEHSIVSCANHGTHRLRKKTTRDTNN